MAALGAKILAARAVGELARRAGRGGGTSLPGRVLIALEPDAIGELAGRLQLGSAIISATNGKTTTAAMVASIMDQTGIPLVHNRAGANMAGGVASTLLTSARSRGRIDGQLGLFEIDEFWLDRVAPQLRPRALLLGNLFRDQLDRYGELDTIAERWARAVASLALPDGLALNADDPLIADLGRDRPDTSYFGVDDPQMALPGMQHAADSKHCRACGTPYTYDAVYLGHFGHYHCPGCGRRRPQPRVVASAIELQGTRSAGFTLATPAGSSRVRLPLPGLYNVYNALGAATLSLALGASLAEVVEGLQRTAAAFGRAETVSLAGVELSILLIKNPAGANEIIRTLTLERGMLDLLVVLNDLTADGHDVSWIWDADFELIAPRVRRVVCSGTRAAELALRLKYAGVPREALALVPDLPRALDDALAGAEERRVFALPTYTALLGLRDELSRRGRVTEFWRQAEPR
jgi:lipid II isoglutaminyl synthase (glutamine-hydrolysing)